MVNKLVFTTQFSSYRWYTCSIMQSHSGVDNYVGKSIEKLIVNYDITQNKTIRVLQL